jgi:hypothetical protein
MFGISFLGVWLPIIQKLEFASLVWSKVIEFNTK